MDSSLTSSAVLTNNRFNSRGVWQGTTFAFSDNVHSSQKSNSVEIELSTVHVSTITRHLDKGWRSNTSQDSVS